MEDAARPVGYSRVLVAPEALKRAAAQPRPLEPLNTRDRADDTLLCHLDARKRLVGTSGNERHATLQAGVRQLDGGHLQPFNLRVGVEKPAADEAAVVLEAEVREFECVGLDEVL